PGRPGHVRRLRPLGRRLLDQPGHAGPAAVGRGDHHPDGRRRRPRDGAPAQAGLAAGCLPARHRGFRLRDHLLQPAGPSRHLAGAILLAAINLLRPDIVILAGALIGACLGFLLFNWYPARIFMGDAGSHFLGFTLAAISVLSIAKGAVVISLAVPLLGLALPIADTAWAIVRRRIRGRSIASADAEHIHHRLLDFGLSPPETALLFYFGTAICAALGLAVYGHT